MSAVPVVLDLGSATFKGGYAGRESPEASFTPVVWEPKDSSALLGAPNEPQVGDCVRPTWEGIWKFSYNRGHELDEECKLHASNNIEKLYMYMMSDKLRYFNDPVPVLISQSIGLPQDELRNIMRLMFESLDVPQLSIVPQPTLALWGTGRTTGFVLESGDGVTQLSAVYEGCALQPGSVMIELAGRDVTTSLTDMARERRICLREARTCLHCRRNMEAEELKIEAAFVAKNFDDEMKRADSGSLQQFEFTDGDGKPATLGSERFRCAEVLFNPKLAGKKIEGIDKLAFDLINQCDSDLRPELWSNFVVSGGNTMLKGFRERLETCIRSRSGAPDDIHFVYPEDPINNVWRGGSALAMSPLFDQMCVSKEYYDEWGADNVARAFF